MRDEDRPDRSIDDNTSELSPELGSHERSGPDPSPVPDNTASKDEPFEESLTEEIAALIDDGRTYAEAELTFRKTQASLAGNKIGRIVGFSVLAIIFLHLTLIALAVGMVLALEPLITIWGAIGVVVGVLLLGVVVLALKVRSNARGLSSLFEDDGA